MKNNVPISVVFIFTWIIIGIVCSLIFFIRRIKRYKCTPKEIEFYYLEDGEFLLILLIGAGLGYLGLIVYPYWEWMDTEGKNFKEKVSQWLYQLANGRK